MLMLTSIGECWHASLLTNHLQGYAMATMTRTFCTHIHPSSIDALIAGGLICLGKGEGAVRPIEVGEVIQRISAKCVINFAKKDVVEASGSLQLCAGQKQYMQ